MGFKDFRLMNSAHLAKQAWRAIFYPEMLWVKLLTSIYSSGTGFLHARRMRGDSWVWASLIHGNDVIKQSAGWSVGDESSIDIKEVGD